MQSVSWAPGGSTVDLATALANLAAGIVVGILIIPLVTSLSEDALHAVPRSLREAAYGLGATKLETAIRVVLPAAMSGITAAFVVAISRAGVGSGSSLAAFCLRARVRLRSNGASQSNSSSVSITTTSMGG